MQHEEVSAFDLWDFLWICGGVYFPPVMLLAIGQWLLRRNKGAFSSLISVLDNLPRHLLSQESTIEGRSLPLPHMPSQDVWQALTHLPHILIVGHTDGGKSVLIRALAAKLVGDGARVIALDSNSADRHYPPKVQLYNESSSWGKVVDTVVGEFESRLQAWRNAPKDILFDALWLISDESQELMAIPACRERIETLIRQGRKVNCHVLLASQDSQVKTLNLEGASALLANLTRCEIWKRDGARQAVINGVAYAIPTLPTTYQSRPVQTSPDPQDQRLLATLLATSLPQSKAVDQSERESPARTGETTPDPAAIRAKLMELGSKNKVAAWLHEEYGIASKGKAYEIIKQAA